MILRGLAVAAVLVLAACQRTISFGDAVPSVTFGGHKYAVVSGDGFNLDREHLTKLGQPSESSLVDQDPFIYALDGIPSDQAAVAYDGGQVVLLVNSQIMEAAPTDLPEYSDPLASLIPALCTYWKDPPRNCP